MERKYRKMEDTKTIAEMNTEADSKLIEWSLKMVREGRVDFGWFCLRDWFGWRLDYRWRDVSGVWERLDGRTHVVGLLKNGSCGSDDAQYSDSVVRAMDAYSRKQRMNRCELVMYGLLLAVLRATDFAWDAEDFRHIGASVRDDLCPLLFAVWWGLLHGRDLLGELEGLKAKGYPHEFIVESLKAELPDGVKFDSLFDASFGFMNAECADGSQWIYSHPKRSLFDGYDC